MYIFDSLKFRLKINLFDNLPYNDLCKMANFGTFRRRVIFLLLSGFLRSFLHRTTLMVLKGSFCLFLVFSGSVPVYTICDHLLCYNLCKMAIFATFSKLCHFWNVRYFFPAVFWHSVTLILFLLFCLWSS